LAAHIPVRTRKIDPGKNRFTSGVIWVNIKKGTCSHLTDNNVTIQGTCENANELEHLFPFWFRIDRLKINYLALYFLVLNHLFNTTLYFQISQDS
jgi:hypothetical protein